MSAILTVDGHVLLPHCADWLRPPELTRSWRSGVAAAMAGNEDRLSVRTDPWLTLSYSVLPFDHVERARFEARMREGIKATKVAVPYWGRSALLSRAAGVGYQRLELDRTTHGMTAGTRVIIMSEVPARHEEWDLCLLDDVSGSVLTLAQPLANAYGAGTRVWRVLFGKPVPQPYEVMNASRSRFTVRVQFDGRQISPTSLDDFGAYSLGDASAGLDGGGYGWVGGWVFSEAA